MVNTNNNKIFNYINYFTLACIVPLGYFAPVGEWLLIGFLALSTIAKFLLKRFKINLDNFYIVLISIFLFIISHLWSINPDRTMEVIGPISGIILSIYIVLNISSTNIIKNIDNIIGIPLLLTSLCIFLDIVFNTEIRSGLALLAGDKPTSDSGNFSRGIVILTMILPISVALFINNKKYILAFIILILVSIVVLIGPNEAAKMALILSYFTALIIYFLGPKSFAAFGIVSLIIIFFIPIISSLALPKIGQFDKKIKIVGLCIDMRASDTLTFEEALQINPGILTQWDNVEFAKMNGGLAVIVDKNNNIIINNKLKNNNKISKLLLEFEKLGLGSVVSKEMRELLLNNNIKCSKIEKWQNTAAGGSFIHRLLVWEYVAKEILKKPLLGQGLGTSRLIGQNIILNVPHTKQEIRGAIPLHPHNNFLEIWLELGLVGIIIFSFLWIKIIKFGITIRKNSYLIGTGVCTSIVSVFVISNISFGVFQAWWMASIALTFLIMLQACKYKK